MDRLARPRPNTRESDPKLFFFFLAFLGSLWSDTSLLRAIHFISDDSDSLPWSLNVGVPSGVLPETDIIVVVVVVAAVVFTRA